MTKVSETVLAARQRAIDAGCPVWKYPYQVYSVATKNKTYFDFSFEWDDDPGYHGNTVYEQIGRDMNNLPKKIYAIRIDDNRASAFFLTKAEAEKERDILNIRHFNIIAMSQDPKNPVRI